MFSNSHSFIFYYLLWCLSNNTKWRCTEPRVGSKATVNIRGRICKIVCCWAPLKLRSYFEHTQFLQTLPVWCHTLKCLLKILNSTLKNNVCSFNSAMRSCRYILIFYWSHIRVDNLKLWKAANLFWVFIRLRMNGSRWNEKCIVTTP